MSINIKGAALPPTAFVEGDAVPVDRSGTLTKITLGNMAAMSLPETPEAPAEGDAPLAVRDGELVSLTGGVGGSLTDGDYGAFVVTDGFATLSEDATNAIIADVAADFADDLTGKVDTTDPALTDRRGIATGDYTAFTVASGGEATLTPAGVLAAITAASPTQAEDIVTALEDPILAVIPGNPFPAATLAQFITGTVDDYFPSVAAIRHMGLAAAKTYAATVTITLNGHRIADGDGDDSDTLISTIAATGDCAIGFANSIAAALVRQKGEIVVSNSGGGARAITLATANGVTVTDAPGVTNPGLGSTAGNTLEFGYTILTTTSVRVDYIRAYT